MFMANNSDTVRSFGAFDSPLGQIAILIENNKIIEMRLEGDRSLDKAVESRARNSNEALLRCARKQLAEYFAGMRSQFELPLELRGTEFQKRVWAAVQRIPAGHTCTYQHIANEIGEPTAARAVGTAVSRNPICIIVPCHRVLASDRSLGRFVAGPERKRQLLAIERAWLH
jgi:methylated-DNA-[protein]-cysteine S-methyltransferase